MYFGTILKMDLYKLLKKKTTYLLFLTLLVPIIFAVGMNIDISFLVTDGERSFDIISVDGVSALQFTANMLSQSNYIIYLVIVVIASMAVANEFETGQIRLYAVRICERTKMIMSKIISLYFMILGYFVIFCLFSIGMYYLFVADSQYGNGTLFLDSMNSVLYIVVTMVGIMVILTITVFLGLLLKTFHCFAVSYLVWFISKYLSFFDNLKMLIPDNCADIIMAEGIGSIQFIKLFAIYISYIIMMSFLSCYVLYRKDIK